MIQSDMNVFVDLYQNIELTYVHLVKICCSYTSLIPKTTKLLEFPGSFFSFKSQAMSSEDSMTRNYTPLEPRYLALLGR